MKNKCTRRIMFISKQAMYAFMIQMLTLISLFAEASGAQRIQDIKVNIQLNNASLEEFFEAIEDQTNLFFAYNDQVISKKKNRFSFSYEKILLEDLLEEVGKKAKLDFKQVNRTISVLEIEEEDQESSQSNTVDPIRIKGKVTDSETGEELVGVSIRVQDTSIGTITDINGNYALSFPEGAKKLIFSFVGYESQDVEIGNQTVIDVKLQQDVRALEEIVVVGYGTQAGKDITGSMTTIQSEKLNDFQVNSFTEALAGVAPGVQVAQTTGEPGAAPSIRVRGVGSITAGNEPLYVIDGFPLGREALSNINKNDIESITILKDASATSIYGSRGANGVILITTKRGEPGAPKIAFESYFGLQEVTKKLDLLSPEEFVQFSIDAKNNAWAYLGNDPNDPNEVRPPFYQVSPYYFDTENWAATDWQDEIFEVAPIKSHQLSVSGGTETVRYMISGNYFNQDGIIKNSFFKRYSLRANIDSELTNRLRLSVGLNASKVDNKKARDQGQFNQGIIGSAINLPGFFSPVNEDGSYSDFRGFGYGVSAANNPMSFINEFNDQVDQTRLLGNVSVEYDILKGLYVKSFAGFDSHDVKNNFFQKSFDYDIPAISDFSRGTEMARGSQSSITDFNWLWENTLHYNLNLGDHTIDALLGVTSQKATIENSSISATNFPDNLVPTLNAGQITGASTSRSEWSMLSYLGRVNYGFKDKYFTTVTVRRDGSSRFGGDNKWGYFPSASIGWIVSEENFLKSSSLINYLKLRASYGISGNNAIPNYGSVGLLSYSDYIIGGNVVTGLVPSTLSNPNLGWETSKQLDVGLEFGLFKDRIRLTADIYQSINDNLLLDVPVPSILGATNTLQNIGKVRNRGLELALFTQNITGEFNWNTDFNISFNRNVVLALGPGGDPIRTRSNQESNITQIGRPIGDFYGYVFEGVYNTMEEIESRPSLATDRPGDPIVKDVNGDGEITADDRTEIGNYQPDFFYGLTNTFRYKNVDFSIFLQGVQGAEIMNLGMRQSMSMSGRTNNLGLARERWRSVEEPGNGKVFSASADIRGVRRDPSTFYIEDGSYLRIRNVTLGYNLSSSLTRRIGMEKARIYLSSQNPFTWTDYSGYNPEVSSYHSSLSPGVDYFNYPLAKVYTIGVNLTF